MSYKAINFDELHESLMEHQAKLKEEEVGSDDLAARELLKAKKAGLNVTIAKRLQKLLMDGKGKEVLAQLKKSGMLKEAVDAKKIIDELIDTSFGGSNEDQMKAVQLLKGLATSDDPASNAFMKKLDAWTSGLKKSEKVEKIACLKCDEVSTKAAWKKNNGTCPKCKKSTKGVAESTIAESIQSDLQSLDVNPDETKRNGKLMTLIWKTVKGVTPEEIAKRIKSGLSAHSDKIKHIGAEKMGAGIKAEIELK